jgi:hypothetical protein
MPIVTIPLLVGWLAVMFYADSHPQHKTQSAASEVASRNSSADPWSAPPTSPTPAGPHPFAAAQNAQPHNNATFSRPEFSRQELSSPPRQRHR